MELAFDLVPTTVVEEKKYFVSYNEWNGEINFVTSRQPLDNTDVFLETSDILAKKILKGDINERDYIVAFVDDENLGIIKRDDKLRLRSSEKTLHQISRTYNKNWDIRAKIYTGNNKLLLEINPISIQKLTKLTFKKELHISKESDLTIYLVKHNNPDFYISRLEVDAVELLDKGNLLFDISDTLQYTNVKDIGLLTRRCFKNYHVEILNEKLNILQNTLVKNRNFIIDRAFKNFPFPHITIYSNADGVFVEKNVSTHELEEIGLLEQILKLHVVGKNSIDEYYGTIYVDVEELKKHNTIKLPVEANNIFDYNLIHNKHRLILSIKD